MSLNLKKNFSKIGSMTLIRTTRGELATGWRDRHMKVKEDDSVSNFITLRVLGREMQLIDPSESQIDTSVWVKIAKELFTRGDKLIPLDREIKSSAGPLTLYASAAPNTRGDKIPVPLVKAMTACELSGYKDQKLIAFFVWLVAALDNAADIIDVQGPWDHLKSIRRDKIVMDWEDIDREFRIYTHTKIFTINEMLTLQSLKKKLFDASYKFYDIATIAEHLENAWNFHWEDFDIDLKNYTAHRNSFEKTVGYLMTNVGSVPSGFNSHAEAEEMLYYSNFVKNVKSNTAANFSIPDARQFLGYINILNASDVSKLTIINSLNLVECLQIKTSTYGVGDTINKICILSANASGCSDLKLGYMREIFKNTISLRNWSEDPQASQQVSSLVGSVFTSLNAVNDIYFKCAYAFASRAVDVVDMTTAFSADVFDNVTFAYLISRSHSVYFEKDEWYFGVTRERARAFNITDRRISSDGPTTNDRIKAIAAMADDCEGKPFVSNPNPFYEAGARTMISYHGNEATFLRTNADGQPIIKFTSYTPDGEECDFELLFRDAFPNISDKTATVLTNLATELQFNQITFLISRFNNAEMKDFVQPYLLQMMKPVIRTLRNTFKDVIQNEIFRMNDKDKMMEAYDYHRFESFVAYDLGVAVLNYVHPGLGDLIEQLTDLAAVNDDQLMELIGL